MLVPTLVGIVNSRNCEMPWERQKRRGWSFFALLSGWHAECVLMLETLPRREEVP